MNVEKQRLEEDRRGLKVWRRWGAYLSERQWGTVREDYSANGDAWNYFPHDHARARAYRWGEDGLAGISDNQQRLCLALGLWNGRDPILKERLFGLTNGEGNHGEDVKELYYYLDATPTHSYLKTLLSCLKSNNAKGLRHRQGENPVKCHAKAEKSEVFCRRLRLKMCKMSLRLRWSFNSFLMIAIKT